MTVDEPDPTDEVVSAVLTASRVLVAVSAASLAAVEDRLTINQFRTLVVLGEEPETNLNGLASRLGVAPSSAMRSVDRLIVAGLVSRRENARNRREVVLSPTAEGRRIVEAVTTTRRRAIRKILVRMPAPERVALTSVFASFARAADEPSVTAPSGLGW